MRNILIILITSICCFALFSISGCSCDDDNSSSGVTTPSANATTNTPTEPAAEENAAQPTTVTLKAFTNFSCTSNWTNRDGALGLVARSGSGTCRATFTGPTSKYKITANVQTEFDGNSKYRISINSKTIKSGSYPLSSSLGCDCPIDKWRKVCPDKNRTIDAGTHTVNKGDIITFYGKEDWNCDDHGAYAKWHYIRLSPR